MSWPLFKFFIKRNWLTFLIFTGVGLFYLAIIILTKEMLAETIEDMGGESHEGVADFNIMPYTVGGFFVSIGTMFPMIYYIMTAHKLLAKTVDNTSLSSHLSAGVSRNKYTTTAGVYLAGSLFAMFFILFAVAAILMSTVESFNMGRFIAVVLTSVLCSTAIASACYFVSCALAGNKWCFGAIIAIPVGLYLMWMLSDIRVLDWLQYITPFGWVDLNEIADGSIDWWWGVALGYAAITVVFTVLAVIFFRRKQLNI